VTLTPSITLPAQQVTPLVKHKIVKKRTAKFKRFQSDRKVTVKVRANPRVAGDSRVDETPNGSSRCSVRSASNPWDSLCGNRSERNMLFARVEPAACSEPIVDRPRGSPPAACVLLGN